MTLQQGQGHVAIALDQFYRRRMSSSTPRKTRQTRATTTGVSVPVSEAALLNDFQNHLHSSLQFIDLYNRYFQTSSSRPLIISSLCHLLATVYQADEFDRKILLFIVDCLHNNSEHLTENQFKEQYLPFFKQVLTRYDDHEIFLSTIRCFLALLKTRSTILSATQAEWLSSLFQFLVTHLSPTNYLNYDELFNELFTTIVKQFSPLSKDLVDVLARPSSPILSTMFLNQLKLWIHHVDDLRFALFTLQLWQSLAKLLSRLVIRGHPKGNSLLAVLEDAFICSNNAIQSATFTVWSSFISHVYQIDDLDQTNVQTRLLKLFLAPFLSDSTSKSKSASISKCHAWLNLISFYPTHVTEVILPFLSFAFGKHISSKPVSTTTAWWPECRQIGAQYLHDLFVTTNHGDTVLRSSDDEILNYIFDFVVEQFFQAKTNEEKPFWLTIWNAFLKHLMAIFQSNQSINEKQRMAINACLLTRVEQCWIDGRIETRLLLKLFESFEQIGFPLAIETVLRDTSVRTKTLSATQNYSSSTNHKSHENSSHCRTTLSDQYVHMMIEHAVRFNDEDPSVEDAYLHVISYLIDTLSKTSDENFCTQSKGFLLKCSVELSIQPMAVPCLFWHIWSRCSTHLIQILNRSHTFESSNQLDNQKQDTALELLLRPFAFSDIPRLDYSTASLWIQLFKALCRLAQLNPEQSKTILMHFIAEFLRHTPAFEQAIHDEQNQRVFGLILIIFKTLIKTLTDSDLTSVNERSNTQSLNLFSMSQKRSLPSSMIFCLNQLSMVLNHILQRLLANTENNTQYSLVCMSLSKSTKNSSLEQSKSIVFTYARDLLVDLFNLCKVYTHFEIVMKNLTELINYLQTSETSTNANFSSPLLVQKQTSDLVLLTKILAVIVVIFESAQSTPLLQLTCPVFIMAFQHNKTVMRNKARKCWNETFGRLTFLIYPNELRACLRDLKEKEHLLLPCFLADQDNSNTAGSGAPPGSTDESQLSQQIDIVTPLVRPPMLNPTRLNFSSPTRSPAPASTSVSNRSAMTNNQDEPIFVPITNNINYGNRSNSPINASKRRNSSIHQCLTEKQKEKLRTRNAIPLLCDDHSNTQSNSCTVDTSMIDDEKEKSKLSTNNSLLFNSISSIGNSMTDPNMENENSDSQSQMDDDHPEESSIAKKLRRSCRPSISARKSLVNKTQKKPAIPAVEEIAVITTPSTNVEQSDHENDSIKKHPIKGILKRLSPTKARTSHTRRVVFHDQVKVLVFASPSRRDPLLLQKKKSPTKEESKSPTRTVPKENLPLRKQPTSARRLSTLPQLEQNTTASAAAISTNKNRLSKLFHPNDALADWTPTSTSSQELSKSNDKTTFDAVYPLLIDCDRMLDDFIPFLCEGECPSNLLDEFRTINIKTVGDLARSTLSQVESYPIPSPKLINLRRALSRYQTHLEIGSTNIDRAVKNDELIPPIASTSDESPTNGTIDVPMESSDKHASSMKTPLYNVEELIASLDYEKFRLIDHQKEMKSIPIETRTIQQDGSNSPGKRDFLSTLQNDEQLISPKKVASSTLTLGDRLQKAADTFKINGTLPFDDDYIELVRLLLNNQTLTNLELLHLKSLFLN